LFFCVCALERTQAAESEASTGSRPNFLRVGSLNICVVCNITANIQCVQGRIGQTLGAYFTGHLVSLPKKLRITLQRSKLALFLLDLYPACTLPSAVAVAVSLCWIAVRWGRLLTNALATEQYADMHYEYGFCSGNSRPNLWNVVPDSVVGIATRFGLDCPGIEPWWRKDLPHSSRPIISPNQPPLKWVPDLPGRTPAGCCVDDPFLSGAQVKERV